MNVGWQAATEALVVTGGLFTPDPSKIKHEVADPQAQDRTHPHFESLMEQKELFVQSTHDQGRRQILVLPPEGNEVISLRTLDVPTPKVDPSKLDEVKASMLRRIGKKIPSANSEEIMPSPIYQRSEKRIPAASGFVTL